MDVVEPGLMPAASTEPQPNRGKAMLAKYLCRFCPKFAETELAFCLSDIELDG